MIDYKIYPQQQLIAVRPGNGVTFDVLMQWHQDLFKRHTDAAKMNGIVDQRGVSSSIMPDELDEILAFNRRVGLSGHWVHLVDQPYETAIAMLYESKAALVQHPVSVCSTEERASHLLGLAVGSYLV